MLHGFLIFMIGLALIAVYLNSRSRARKAVKNLEQRVEKAKRTDANPNRWHSADDLLAGAERALEKGEWDKAEELCELGFDLLELATREVAQSHVARRPQHRGSDSPPERLRKQRSTSGWTTARP